MQKYTEARKKANAKWDKENIERVGVVLRKGEKDIIKNHAAIRGESVNGFIRRAIFETIERENAK